MNNQNNMFSNMGQVGGVPEVKDNNINGNLNAVLPNQMVSNDNNVGNNSAGVLPQGNGGTLNFSMPSVNDSTSNSNVNVMPQNNNDVGSYTFVNPSVTGVANNGVDSNLSAIGNSIPNSGVSNNVSNIINNDVGSSMSQNSGNMGNLNFELGNNKAPLLNQNNSLVNNGMSLENNDLMNNGAFSTSNNLMNDNVSNSLVSSQPMEGFGGTSNSAAVSNNSSNGGVVSVKKYLGHILLFSIPGIGFIMLLIKAFGKNDDKNISNFAKAQLILGAIFCGLFAVLFIFAMIFGVAADSTQDSINSQWDEMQSQSIDSSYGY